MTEVFRFSTECGRSRAFNRVPSISGQSLYTPQGNELSYHKFMDYLFTPRIDYSLSAHGKGLNNEIGLK